MELAGRTAITKRPAQRDLGESRERRAAHGALYAHTEIKSVRLLPGRSPAWPSCIAVSEAPPPDFNYLM